MKCELCHKNDAQRVLHKEIDGKDRELYVCQHCADLERAFTTRGVNVALKRIGSEPLPKEALDQLGNLLSTLTGHKADVEDLSGLDDIPDLDLDEDIDSSPMCEQCGMSLRQFLDGRALGCADCYHAFEPHLRTIFQRTQPGVAFDMPHTLKSLRPALNMPVPSSEGILLLLQARIFRNVERINFLSRISESNAITLRNDFLGIIRELNEQGRLKVTHLLDSERDRELFPMKYSERVSSPNYVQHPKYTNPAVVVDCLLGKDEFLVEINCDQHLSLRTYCDGIDLKRHVASLEAFEQMIGETAPFAKDPQLGYLCDRPELTGLGMSFEIDLFLPGLLQTERLSGVINAASRLGFSLCRDPEPDLPLVESLCHFKSDYTMGVTQDQLLQRVQEFIDWVVCLESQARVAYRHDFEPLLYDQLHRTLAWFNVATLLTTYDALYLLTLFLTGLQFKLLKGVPIKTLINEILLIHCHLQARRLPPSIKALQKTEFAKDDPQVLQSAIRACHLQALLSDLSFV